ncbi:uncharacterized protein [Diabrotica undecimpunctata]|uniref:uncharacterized protein n=1 Tax=Diabrotica undecimpunctata TaxID=50387 RepID=UPI003B6393BD
MLENEDDYDFIPSDSSKLSSLFGSLTMDNEETNNSLMYTAPKQPNHSKIQQNTEKQSKSSKVLLIKIVSLWKSEDNTFKPVGKHGLAIIGSDELKVYEIIAYKHKTHTILRAKVSDQFYFQQRKDNLSSFIDNNQQNWLVKFETQEQQLEFTDLLKFYGAQILLEPLNNSKDEKKVNTPVITTKPETSSNYPDSDSSDSTRKANILSRITKMGQQVVPKPVPTLESDISDENESHESKTRKFRKVKKTEREEIQYLPETVSTELIQKPLLSVPQVYYSQPAYGDLNSVLLAQNSELRCSLNQISQKLDNLSSQNIGSTSNLSSKVKVLELRTENLQTELQRYKQKCYDLEMKNTAHHSKQDEKSLEISHLKETIAELSTKLLEANSKSSNLEDFKHELEENKLIILELENVIETQKHSLEELDLLYQQSKTTNMEANLLIKNLNHKIKEHEMHVQNSDLEKIDLHQGNLQHINILSDLVKTSMNGMYQSILNSLDQDGADSFNDVQSVLAKNLKDTSFRIINGIKAELKSEDDKNV